MAALTGTTQTYGVGSAGGNREDLEDVIWQLSPLETYCLTNFDRVDANATLHEWEIDSMVAPAANRQLEGDDVTFTSIVSPTRVGNYTQISRKEFLVSGTQEQVKSAGRPNGRSEVKRQLKKKMMELKNDMEYAIVRNQVSSAGGATTARSLGSIETFIATTDNSGNGVRATTTAAASTAAYAAGSVVTDGTTTGTMQEAKFKEAVSLAWVDGGQPSIVLVESIQKQTISAFSGIATKYNDVSGSKATIVGSADVYASEWGDLTIKLHRHVRSSVCLILDPDYWAIAFLRSPFMEELAKTGDGWKRHMLAEYTLVGRNANSSAKVVACA